MIARLFTSCLHCILYSVFQTNHFSFQPDSNCFFQSTKSSFVTCFDSKMNFNLNVKTVMSEKEKNQVVFLLGQNKNVSEIAREIERLRKTVEYVIKKFKETGLTSRKKGPDTIFVQKSWNISFWIRWKLIQMQFEKKSGLIPDEKMFQSCASHRVKVKRVRGTPFNPNQVEIVPRRNCDNSSNKSIINFILFTFWIISATCLFSSTIYLVQFIFSSLLHNWNRSSRSAIDRLLYPLLIIRPYPLAVL